MKAGRSATGSAESSSRTSPTASARRTLRRISWRSFLPSVPSQSSIEAPWGRVATGQTSSCSTVIVQPQSRSRRPKAAVRAVADGSPQRSRRRSTASHCRGVMRVAAVREVVGGGLGDPVQVAGRGQQRGVVGVVRGAEEHGLGVGRDGRQRRAVLVPDARAPRAVAGLHLVTVHQRDDAHGLRAGCGPGRDHDQGLLVGVRAVAVPPRPMHGPARERGRPGVRVDEGVPLGRFDRVERATLGPQRGKGHRRGRDAGGRRTVGFAGH